MSRSFPVCLKKIRTATMLILCTLLAMKSTLPTQAQPLIMAPEPAVPDVTSGEQPAPGEPKLSPQSQSYRLGVGDRIHIDIFDSPEYSGEYSIGPEGVLRLPLVPPISALHLTIEQLSDEITKQYNSILKRPFVRVTIIRPRSLTIGVTGEVDIPGVYAIAPEIGRTTRLRYPTVTEVISSAGGITLAADIRRVQVRRQSGKNQEQVIILDLWRFLQQGTGSIPDINLRDGDIVFVPTITTINLEEVPLLATSSFAIPAAKPRNITVVGEVNKPGSYVTIGGPTRSSNTPGGLPTVTWAIRTAGGITQLADIRSIQIQRSTKTGTEQMIEIDLWQFLQTGDLTQDTVVQDGDRIIVPTATEINLAQAVQLGRASFSPDSIIVYVIGERPPGSVREIRVPPNTPLNEALLAAGGFIDRRVSQSSVGLIRLKDDGTTSFRQIPIELAAGVNQETNPLLTNNDVIIVSRSGLARLLDISDAVGRVLNPVNSLRSLVGIFDILGIINNQE
ncbi:MAG: polysaccharide biosynthesis/export family protein [Hormoscilla sp.]